MHVYMGQFQALTAPELQEGSIPSFLLAITPLKFDNAARLSVKIWSYQSYVRIPVETFARSYSSKTTVALERLWCESCCWLFVR